MLKRIMLVSLPVLIGLVVGIGVFGCKKEEPIKEEGPTKESVSLEGKSYKQCKILFSSDRDGNREIYVMNADGSEQENLTNNPANDGGPLWSPDGKKISFISWRDGNYEIYIMNPDGSEQKSIINNPRPILLNSWSPDGKKIGVVLGHEPVMDGNIARINYEIYVINADGSNLQRLTNNPAADYSLFWSPDGEKIAFVSDRDGNAEIYIMNANGSEQKRLTYNPGIDGGFWTPDGERMVLVSDKDGNAEIYLMSLDGIEQKRLTNDPNNDFGVCWSPDGKKMIFIREHGAKEANRRDRNREIYIMNADGSEQKRLTNNPSWDFDPIWSPDGKKIVFVSERDGNYEIYIINPDGSEQKNLTTNPARDMDPSWSPFSVSENRAVEKK